jgi:hypothetical protein
MNKECLVSTALTTNFTVSLAREFSRVCARWLPSLHTIILVKVTTTPKVHVMALRDGPRHLRLVRHLLRSPFTTLPYIHPKHTRSVSCSPPPPPLADQPRTQSTTALPSRSAINTPHTYLTYIPFSTHSGLQPCLEATTSIRA